MKDSPKANKKEGTSFSTLHDFIIWVALPIFLFALFLIAIVTDVYIKNDIPAALADAPVFLAEKYPFFSTENASTFPILTAHAAVIIDDKSQVVLFSKEPQRKLPMASTTKIMTALVGLSHFRLHDPLTVQTEKVEGAKVGFKVGDVVLFEDMLYGLLLPSGNDAALAIAENYPGGQPAFVAEMNTTAKKLHLVDTQYEEPTGLSEKNVTTVVDLARLASVALRNPVFSRIVKTKEKTITLVNRDASYTVHNLNKLLETEGVTGIKTGFTDEAGEVLVTSTEKNGYRLLIVVMKSRDRFADTQKILSFIDENIRFMAPELLP